MIAVTGGAGFIGRWVVKRLLDDRHEVCVLDDLSNGRAENIEEFRDNPKFEFILGDVRNKEMLENLFKDVDICIHAAAAINVQESIENPQRYYDVNVNGTFNILEMARKRDVKVVLIGTCMVYDLSSSEAINEKHSLNPKSPYAGSKLAAENLAFVEDCADFIVEASFNEKAVGELINAGYGQDIAIKDLAFLICKDSERIRHVEHHHPQSEIPKLLCDYTKVKKLLGWEPKTSLEEGIEKTKKWIKSAEL
jgi:nucleoside-diphosphate-sugar epimerase